MIEKLQFAPPSGIVWIHSSVEPLCSCVTIAITSRYTSHSIHIPLLTLLQFVLAVLPTLCGWNNHIV